MMHKILIAVCVVLASVILFQYFTIQRERNDAIEAQQELIASMNEERQRIVEKMQENTRNELLEAQGEAARLKEYSNNLIKQIRNYEKNPTYDIDFLAAFDIITKSDYKSRGGNNNP